MSRSPAAAPATSAQTKLGRGPPYSYARRRPERTPLYRIVQDNLDTLYAAIEQGFTSELPKFVTDELEAFLDCGIASRGFALLSCEDCPEKKLVAWSCKGRAFCPSCFGRRMAQGAANLVEHVLPPKVPLWNFPGLVDTDFALLV